MIKLVTIERAKAKDYKNFLNVFSELEEFHRINVPWKFKKPIPELFAKKYYNEILNNKDAIFLIAKDKQKIVGFIIGFKQDSADKPILKKRSYILVDNLGVESSYRKNGIGVMLMAELEKLAVAKGINEIELSVWIFNKNAVNFYKNRGYKVFSQKMRKVLV